MHECSVCLKPHGLQPTRLLCPWNFPGKNTRVCYLFLLHGILPTQGSSLRLLHWQEDSLPRTWVQFLKLWEILGDKSPKVVFVMLMMFLLDPTLEWDLVSRTSHVMKGLKLLVHTREGRGPGG